MGPQTTAMTVGLFPLAAIPPQISWDLLTVSRTREIRGGIADPID